MAGHTSSSDGCVIGGGLASRARPRGSTCRLGRSERASGTTAGLVANAPQPEPQPVRDRQHRADRRPRPARSSRPGVVQVPERLEPGLFGDEAERTAAARPSTRRPARPRARSLAARGRRPDSRRRSRVPVAWSTTPTTRNSAALNSACATSMRQRPRARSPACRARRADEEAELADRAVREQQLEVVLPQRAPAAEQHGRRSRARRRSARQPGHVGERRGEPRDQVDAGLDHRGGVQVGAHRGRRRHRRGQPEVEREQRRLGQRADQQQHDRRRSPRWCPCGGSRDDLGQPVRARRLAQQHEPDQHREAAGGGDDDAPAWPPAGSPCARRSGRSAGTRRRS